MQQKKILFLGETFRADAQTWISGLKEFGNFEVITWELHSKNNGFYKFFRIIEYLKAIFYLKKWVNKIKPDMIIAERTTSYGYLATHLGVQPTAVAQQGITDIFPANGFLSPFKHYLQNYTFKHATLLHAWGTVMEKHMLFEGVNPNKILVLPKGINLKQFEYKTAENFTKIKAIVTRSFKEEYKHDLILKAFSVLKTKKIVFELTLVGGGILFEKCKDLAKKLNIENEVIFTNVIPNYELPKYLQNANIYISFPTTEGVSASLFEAMASGCYPIVTKLPGNESWINHQQNGLLVNSENENDLINQIIWATQNWDICNQAIQNNRKFVENNANYEINMKKIAAYYHQLINNKSL